MDKGDDEEKEEAKEADNIISGAISGVVNTINTYNLIKKIKNDKGNHIGNKMEPRNHIKFGDDEHCNKVAVLYKGNLWDKTATKIIGITLFTNKEQTYLIGSDARGNDDDNEIFIDRKIITP